MNCSEALDHAVSVMCLFNALFYSMPSQVALLSLFYGHFVVFPQACLGVRSR
jgi:hypothetical protein